ncbi:hypothetical protein N1851_011163 [Merluccius polli]|uniref:Uncharacterized protein n=1 Tax=Merluccius polli TaxID=89951 RepID=A0AA47MXJ1_MERPO|nr:hypothetical protein N1851_011163 [Merluccius polli]
MIKAVDKGWGSRQTQGRHTTLWHRTKADADPDAAQSPKQPGYRSGQSDQHNINKVKHIFYSILSQTSHTVRTLYAKHLERQIELADVKITLKKRKLQEMELDLEIKRRTLRKLDLEIQKLEREACCDGVWGSARGVKRNDYPLSPSSTLRILSGFLWTIHNYTGSKPTSWHAGMPGVVATDGTHIQIIAPSKDEDVFVNRKKVHTSTRRLLLMQLLTFLMLLQSGLGLPVIRRLSLQDVLTPLSPQPGAVKV